jgi:hypothetical protein
MDSDKIRKEPLAEFMMALYNGPVAVLDKLMMEKVK